MKDLSFEKLKNLIIELDAEEQFEIMQTILESGNSYVTTNSKFSFVDTCFQDASLEELENEESVKRLKKSVSDFGEWCKKNPKADRFMPRASQVGYLSKKATINNTDAIFDALFFSFVQGAKYGGKYLSN